MTSPDLHPVFHAGFYRRSLAKNLLFYRESSKARMGMGLAQNNACPLLSCIPPWSIGAERGSNQRDPAHHASRSAAQPNRTACRRSIGSWSCAQASPTGRRRQTPASTPRRACASRIHPSRRRWKRACAGLRSAAAARKHAERACQRRDRYYRQSTSHFCCILSGE